MNRGKKIVILAHCLLNVNAKVEGIAHYPGAFEPLVLSLIRKGFGIIQLPCPEMGYYGVRRWGQVIEQMDTPAFRTHCRKILHPVIEQIQDYHTNGYLIAGIVGVDKSPSCGVHQTCSSDLFKGEITCVENLDAIKKSLSYPDKAGIFMEELKQIIADYGFEIPFVAIDEESTIPSAELYKLFLTD